MVALLGAIPPAAAETPASSFFPLQVHWSTEFGQPSAAPAGFDDERAYIPLRDGTVTAVRLSDGTVAWSVEQPTQLPPAVGGGLVVVASGSELIARYSADARHAWMADVGADVSVPLLWTSGWLVAALRNGDVVTLRGSDGFELWRINVSGKVTTRPSVAGDQLFLPLTDGRIVAVALPSGERIWETMLGGSPQEILPVDDLFVGATDNFFYRLARSDGRMRWRWRTGADIIGLPTVNVAQVVFASLDNMVRALDRNTGALRWRRPLSGRPTGGPQAGAGMVFVSGVSPDLYAFDMVSGRSAGILRSPGEFAAPPHIISPPSPLAPGIIVTTGDGTLVGFFGAIGPPRLALDFPPPPLLPGPELLEASDVLTDLPVAVPETLSMTEPSTSPAHRTPHPLRPPP